MKDLINSIIAAFNTAITGGTLSAKRVYKGLQENPEEIPRKFYPYIAVDDAGENTTEDGVDSNTAINRIYSVGIEMAVWTNDIESSLDDILDFSNEVKSVLELEVNRFKDSHIWGISIIPAQWVQDEKYFYRGRRVIVEYYDLEDRYDDF
jgi:predicted restriction endonuclease